MIDEEFFMSLPPDPAEAFPIYERHVREKCFPEGEHEQGSTYERDYINLMLAFINYYKLDIGITPEIPPADSDFWGYYNHARRLIDYHAAQFTLQRLDRIKSGAAGIYVLTPALRQEIHHYINRIRETMNGIALPNVKREALFNKLNAFAAEVDRDRTSIEAIASAFVWLKREVKDGVDILTPVLGHVERILDKFAKAKELPEALPLPRRGGEIEGPRKKLPSPKEQRVKDDFDDLDDESRSDARPLRCPLSQPSSPHARTLGAVIDCYDVRRAAGRTSSRLPVSKARASPLRARRRAPEADLA